MINERVKEIRKALNLSGTEFGDSLGISKTAISYLESGKVNLTEGNIKLICSVYDVNEDWLRNGTGEMFNPIEDNLDYLVGKYGGNLSPGMQAMIKTLLLLPDEKRKAFDDFLEEFDRLRGKKDK